MPDFHQDEQPSSARDYRLSPRKVAMWSSVAAVAAVAALIAVAAVNDADALNTVALYLAVIAFVAQLIMYVAQNESSARQLKQSQDVQRQTSMMLSEIRQQSAAMQHKLDEEHAVMVNALVEQAANATERLAALQHVGQGKGEGSGSAPSEEALAQLRDQIRAELAETAEEVVRRYADEQVDPLLLKAPTYRPFPIRGAYLNGPVDMEKVNATLATLEKARRAQADIDKAQGIMGEP